MTWFRMQLKHYYLEREKCLLDIGWSDVKSKWKTVHLDKGRTVQIQQGSMPLNMKDESLSANRPSTISSHSVCECKVDYEKQLEMQTKCPQTGKQSRNSTPPPLNLKFNSPMFWVK